MNRFERLRASRRKFLLSLGVSAGAFPFLRLLPSYAQGQGTTKLITVFSGNGRIRHRWGADDSAGTLKFRENLAPLQPFADAVTVLEGVRNFSAPTLGGTHEGGVRSLFTGSSQTSPTHPSIDALFMSQVQGTARRDSLYQQVVAQYNNAQNAGPNNRIAFDASGVPRDPLRSGWEVSEQYLAGAIANATPNAGAAAADQANKALFAALEKQMTQVMPRLCAEDRYQLEGMADAVHAAGQSMNQVVCSPPALPPKPIVQPWEPIWQPPADAAIPLTAASHWYRDRSRLAIDLLVASLACGVTRSGVLQYDQGASDAVAVGQAQSHHNISHSVPQSQAFVEGITGTAANNYAYTEIDHQADPTPALRQQFDPVWNQLSQWETYYAEEVAYLIGRLQTFGILNDTLLIWGTEIDNSSAHEHWNMPFVLAAGAQIPIHRGAVVRYPLSYQSTKVTPNGPSRSHHDLLRSVLQAVGTPVDSVGDPAQNQGVLKELLA